MIQSLTSLHNDPVLIDYIFAELLLMPCLIGLNFTGNKDDIQQRSFNCVILSIRGSAVS